jgi:hypothetical protein
MESEYETINRLDNIFGAAANRTAEEELELTPTPVYENRWTVCIYQVDRHFGGPEEGGWWYDSGNLFRLVSVEKTREAAYAKCVRANHLLHLVRRKTSRTDRFSMAYQGNDFEFEAHQGLPHVHFPEVRPHYE